jgi:hypothetical protein
VPQRIVAQQGSISGEHGHRNVVEAIDESLGAGRHLQRNVPAGWNQAGAPEQVIALGLW